MDPNATLAEMRKLISEIAPGKPISDDFPLLFDGLDNWLSRGGFLPEAWAR